VSKTGQYIAEEILAILHELTTGRATLLEVADKYEIHKTTLPDWRHRYELYGYQGVEIRTHNQRYSTDLKPQAVQYYLS